MPVTRKFFFGRKDGPLACYRTDIAITDPETGRNDVYMERWVLSTRYGALRLHHILRSDGDRDLHDHPFDFWSLLLTNGYTEVAPGGFDNVSPRPAPSAPGKIVLGRELPDVSKWWPRFSVVRKKAEDLHRLELTAGPVWTLVWSGPVRREWGFQTPDGWIAHDRYDLYKRLKADPGA